MSKIWIGHDQLDFSERWDTMNGERVNCFFWVYFNHGLSLELQDDGLVRVGRNSREYRNGDKIPWKSMVYNYTKDFLIVDFPAQAHFLPQDTGESWHPIVIHRVMNGILEGTYYPEPGDFSEDPFLPGQKVITARGTAVNLHSMEDLYRFYQEHEDYYKKKQELYDSYPDYYGMMNDMYFDRPQDETSTEYTEYEKRVEVLDRKIKEMKKEQAAILAPLEQAFDDHWNVPDSHIPERSFGCFLQASMQPMFWKNTADMEEILVDFEINFHTWLEKAPEDIVDRFCEWYRATPEFKEQITRWVEEMLDTDKGWDGKTWAPKETELDGDLERV